MRMVCQRWGLCFGRTNNFTHTCKFPGALELYRRLWHAHTPGKSQVTWKFTGPEKIQGTWNFSGPLDYFRSPGNFQGAPKFTLDEQWTPVRFTLLSQNKNFVEKIAAVW